MILQATAKNRKKKLPRDFEIDLVSIKKRKVSCEVFARPNPIKALSFPFK